MLIVLAMMAQVLLPSLRLRRINCSTDSALAGPTTVRSLATISPRTACSPNTRPAMAMATRSNGASENRL